MHSTLVVTVSPVNRHWTKHMTAHGTLFAPRHFREHRDLASNTGIVPVYNLHKVFPHYNAEMLIQFLESLDFCRPVDHSMLQYTNLQTTTLSHSKADLLFFSLHGLIHSK